MNDYIIYILYSLIILPLIVYLIKKMLRAVIKKAKTNLDFKNDVISFSYLIRDLGPNVFAFSVVSMFTAQRESIKTLVIVALVGIALHLGGRKLRNQIYKKTDNHFIRKSDFFKRR